MLVKLNQENFLKIDPAKGCQVQQLTLGGKTIIQFMQKQPFLGSGSYLMFPWVNRIIQNPYNGLIQNQFSDGKGYPLHGLFANTKREMKTQEIQKNNRKKIQINVSNSQVFPKIHGFTETFTISENTLQIDINVLEQNEDPNPYCFGYHPYFQMSKPLQEIKISTNLSSQLVLHEDLLMKWPKQKKQWQGKIDGKQKYDSLFQGAQQLSEDKLGNFVELDDGINKVRIESNLEYWQIYTPEDGRRIAIEPMSFHGNIYDIVKQNPQIRHKLPKSGKIRIFLS